MQPTPANQSGLPEIWILLVYTERAAERFAGPDESLHDMVELAIIDANQSLEDSSIHLKLVNKELLPVSGYSEMGQDCVILEDRLTVDGDNYLDEVHFLRNLYACDVVVLLFDNPHCIGKACENLATESEAFAVVHAQYALENRTLAHEVGHLLGGRHFTDPATTPFPSAHGHCEPGCWYTIMTKSCECPSGLLGRIPRFSNPSSTFPCLLQDRATGSEPNCNVARVFNQTGSLIAGFRDPAQLGATPASLMLEPGESQGLAILVTREGVGVANAALRLRSEDESTAEITSISSAGTAGEIDVTVEGVTKGRTKIIVLAEGARKTIPVKVVPAGSLAALILGCSFACVALWQSSWRRHGGR
jgi:hypothetical protein